MSNIFAIENLSLDKWAKREVNRIYKLLDMHEFESTNFSYKFRQIRPPNELSTCQLTRLNDNRVLGISQSLGYALLSQQTLQSIEKGRASLECERKFVMCFLLRCFGLHKSKMVVPDTSKRRTLLILTMMWKNSNSEKILTLLIFSETLNFLWIAESPCQFHRW